jgi:type I restriction enzyme R subunit
VRAASKGLDVSGHAISDAVAELGRPEEIGMIFAGFQKYLYQPPA